MESRKKNLIIYNYLKITFLKNRANSETHHCVVLFVESRKSGNATCLSGLCNRQR